MIEIKWLGRGGQGGFTAARILGLASTYEGMYAQAFPSFGPERRGAPVHAFTRIDMKKITDRSNIGYCDYLIILDETLLEPSCIPSIQTNCIIINSNHPQAYSSFTKSKIFTLDATSIALKTLGIPITNIAMLGGLIGISQMLNPSSCKRAIASSMKKDLIDKNILLFEKAYKVMKGESIHG